MVRNISESVIILYGIRLRRGKVLKIAKIFSKTAVAY